MKSKAKSILFLPLIIILATCCDNKPDVTNELPSLNKIFLENQFDYSILPAFSDLKSATDVLAISVNTFSDNPTQSNLDAAQTAYQNAAIAFQYVTPFNFGPSEDGISAIKENINTFPVKIADIEAFITANNASFNDFRRDCRGLGTIDYLLHTVTGTDAEVLAKYGAGSDNRKTYLKAVANNIKTQVDATNEKWKNYRTTFTTDASTTASSSITKLYNGMLIAHEDIKNFKLGIPLGEKAGQPNMLPEQIEAYHSGISLILIENNIKAIENVWQCKSKTGTKGSGFDGKLLAANNQSLVTNTQNQFKSIYTAYGNIPDGKLSNIMIADASTPKVLYSCLSSLTRFIKSDLSSALGLTITYSSNDGD